MDFGRSLFKSSKHKIGKSCRYGNKLADIDLEIPAERITAGLDDLGRRWPVLPN